MERDGIPLHRCIWFERGGGGRICPLGNTTRRKATVTMGETKDSAAFVVFWRDDEEEMAFEAMLQERISNISKINVSKQFFSLSERLRDSPHFLWQVY